MRVDVYRSLLWNEFGIELGEREAGVLFGI